MSANASPTAASIPAIPPSLNAEYSGSCRFALESRPLFCRQSRTNKSAQAALKPVKRSLEILHAFFQKPETVRAWLNTPHPDLDGHTAFEMILANNSNAVLRILENAAAGVPV